MFKKIFLGSVFLLSLHTFAQEGTASPYSFYGIGDVKFKGTIENRAMGGLSFLADSIHVNIQNPASIASLKMSSFTVAGTHNFVSLKNETQKESVQRTSLDYLTIGIPVGKKWGMYAGLMPFSSVGYKIENRNESTGEITRFTGTGGINKVFVGAGYEIAKNFNFGIDIAYNFGKTETNSAYFPDLNLQTGTRLLTTSRLKGMNMNFGGTYKTKINKLDFVSGIGFSPSFNLKATNEKNLGAVVYSTSGADLVDPDNSQDLPTENYTFKLPSKFSLGAGIGDTKKWFVGIETTFFSASDFANVYQSNNASFESSQKLSIGGYYIPKYNSFSNYLERVNYRAGFRHENTGLVINSQSIKDTAFTVGLGLPVPGMLSNVNIGFEIGSKGTTKAGLIQENYYNLSIGLSLNDKWFVKRKYD